PVGPTASLDEAELSGKNNVLAAVLDRRAHLQLGVSVDVCRVEEVDSQLERAPDDADRSLEGLGAARVDVRDAQAHRSESEGGNGRAVTSQSALLHVDVLRGRQRWSGADHRGSYATQLEAAGRGFPGRFSGGAPCGPCSPHLLERLPDAPVVRGLLHRPE